jgi:D-alanyl-D-alanine carboxypeptidase/D-alanyl-D-alanine-endopeptidase (penicillin-binding protein 4)
VQRRGRIALRTAALVCAAGAVTAFALARPPAESRGAPTPPAEPLRTPIFSPRRAPALFVPAVQDTQLQRDLAAAVGPYDACVAVDGPNGPAARVNATTPLDPASNMKLLTSVAALETMGEDTRFTTKAYVDGDDLVIVGGGDPMFTSGAAPPPFSSLDAFAAKIRAAHPAPFDAIVVDGSRYDSSRFPPTWKPNYVPEGEAGAIGALTVDRGYESYGHAAADPAVLFGTKLRPLVHAGSVRAGTLPAGAREIASVDSAPLGDIVGEILRDSNNYGAEMLMREIGYRRGHAGSTAAGIEETLPMLKRLGVPTAGVVMQDGSGLSPDDRVTCDALLAAVRLASKPKFAAIDRGLPVAGETGTLANRFRGDPLAGRLRAKTGSIDNVVALSGTIDQAEHPTFSFMANGGFTKEGGYGLQSAVAHAVATYPAPVDLKRLVPAP